MVGTVTVGLMLWSRLVLKEWSHASAKAKRELHMGFGVVVVGVAILMSSTALY